ncbi:hypothetical protein E2C01_020080 [Portunus trituberculatus]|uniref:Uncharacterized protein n=1 Tax=Portunus trituberculatus TaxID=210409 RepID=A0A5B7E0J7_PORTR|nr:hypothetical protein [Portunus trituberculatus]
MVRSRTDGGQQACVDRRSLCHDSEASLTHTLSEIKESECSLAGEKYARMPEYPAPRVSWRRRLRGSRGAGWSRVHFALFVSPGVFSLTTLRFPRRGRFILYNGYHSAGRKR